MKAPPNNAPPKKSSRNTDQRVSLVLRQFALAIELPFVFVAAVVIGGAIGQWLDSRFHTSPLFLLILGALGFAAGLREVIRRLAGWGSRRGQ